MNAVRNGKIDGWPQELVTAYVDSGSNVDLDYEKFLVITHLMDSTQRSREDCIAKLKELDFSDAMIKGHIGALSGGWQMKLRLCLAVLLNPDIYLLDEVSVLRESPRFVSRACLVPLWCACVLVFFSLLTRNVILALLRLLLLLLRYVAHEPFVVFGRGMDYQLPHGPGAPDRRGGLARHELFGECLYRCDSLRTA